MYKIQIEQFLSKVVGLPPLVITIITTLANTIQQNDHLIS